MHYFTQKQYNELKARLKYLTEVKYEKLNEGWRLAVNEGDDRETDALTVALNMLHNHHYSVKELREVLENSEIIQIKRTTKVKVGTKVTFLMNSKKFTYEITDPFIADISKNRISFESPLGKIFLGKKVSKFTTSLNSIKKDIEILNIKINS